MEAKQELEAELSALRITDQRLRLGYADGVVDVDDIKGRIEATRERMAALDDQIGPLARAAGSLRNEAWGPIMRAGQDKSLFARQVERYADVYTSRVSNFLYPTPFAMLRAVRLDLPHDPHPEHQTENATQERWLGPNGGETDSIGS